MRRDSIPNYTIPSDTLIGDSSLVVNLPLQGSTKGFVPVYYGDGSNLTLKYADVSNLSCGEGNEIVIDQTFNGNSSNAQSGVAVKSAITTLNPNYPSYDSLALGPNSQTNSYSTAVGYGAACSSYESVANGYNAQSSIYSVSNGYCAVAHEGAIAMGRNAYSDVYSVSIGYRRKN